MYRTLVLGRLRIGIVGQGTAGTAAALFLARSGHEVHVYERVLEPGPVGAGIVLQPTGMAVLEQLGLRDAVVARGAPLEGITVRTPAGRRVIDLDYGVLAPDLYGLGLHRGALFQAMTTALVRSSVVVETGVDARSIVREGERSYVVDVAGKLRGPHDVIVVADGARSLVAESFFPRRRQTAYPWGAIWFVARDDADAFQGRLQQVVRGAERMIGLLPTGTGPELLGEGARQLVSLYYSVRSDRVEELRRGFVAWKDEVLALMPEAAPVLAQIHDESQLLFTSYQDVRLWPWHRENVVAIGDAAHAMSPQLGQGANLALWDAMILEECMAEAQSLSAALASYSLRRRAHLAWFQWATRFLTPFFQGDSRFLGLLRDVAMPMLGRIAPFRRLMIASMVGNTSGPFRSALELPSRPPRLLAAPAE